MPAREAALTTAISAAAWSKVRAEAHYLRNSALVLQAASLFAAGTGLETAAHAADPTGVQQWWSACRYALGELRGTGFTGPRP